MIPIRYIISSRRLIYHQCILKRNYQDLRKRSYSEQKRNPTKGDFVELIRDDFKLIDETQNDMAIQMTNTEAYKKMMKKRIKVASFNFLKSLQSKHSTVKDIKYVKS